MPDMQPGPVEILQKLLRFDTTNPPGNEGDCIAFVSGLLGAAGIEHMILESPGGRPNLVARTPGRGEAPPLLLYGHADVVTVEGQPWSRDPFGGELHEGFVWGRGALDMKGGVAMMLSAVMRCAGRGSRPPGDVLLAIVADEESGGEEGAGFLADRHGNLFHGVRHALGEFGGFSVNVSGKRLYPVQVAEKQVCWMRAVFRGPGGHGSMPVKNGAIARLAQFLRRLEARRLPLHVTPHARLMFDAVSESLGGLRGLACRLAAVPLLTDFLLERAGVLGRFAAPVLRNTATPTTLRGSGSMNVIPGEASAGLDGRLLPGFSPEDLMREIGAVAGRPDEFEVVRFYPGPPEPDMSLFGLLAETLREADPGADAVPFFLAGATDAHHFSRLGIQTYGFLPMPLPAGFDFIGTVHAADERVPAEAVEFGAEMMARVIGRMRAGDLRRL